MELSIIVPIYNVEQYLENALNSIYKISGIEKEIILVNDGTKDSSEEIIKKFKELYPVETVVINKENGGLSSARNAGLKLAKGEYVAFIDSDDFIDPVMFQEFFKVGTQEKLDIVIGNARYYKDGEIGDPLFRSEFVKNSGVVTGREFLDIMFKPPKCYREEVWDDLYRRDFLLENDLTFLEGAIHEDSLFTTLAYLKAKKLKYFDYPFYFYRQREGGIMSTVNQKSIDSLEKICYLLRDEYLKLQGDSGKQSLSKLIISFYKVVVYKEYAKGGPYKEKYKKYLEFFIELHGFKNHVLNETLLFFSLPISIMLRKLTGKEITDKQKLPVIKQGKFNQIKD